MFFNIVYVPNTHKLSKYTENDNNNTDKQNNNIL